MLTRREILHELRRIGVKEVSLLKEYLEDFEHYWELNYGLEMSREVGIAEDTIRIKMCFK